MSLESDLNSMFIDNEEPIINEHIKFKMKLGIGDKAYSLIRAREHLTTFSETLGIGATASAMAATPLVAGTFFAHTGFLASLGIGAAAATPIGWVIAAGVLSGAAYAGTSRFFERSKDSHLIVIPKYINTPLDIIAIALIEMMLPISLRVANSDGKICDQERSAIREFYAGQWGYNPNFVNRLIEEFELSTDKVSFAQLAKTLEEYCVNNPDCDPHSIMNGFLVHIREVVEADGKFNDEELKQLAYLTTLLEQAADKSLAARTVESVRSGLSAGVTKTSTILTDGTRGVKDVAIGGVDGLIQGANKVGKVVNQGLGGVKNVASDARKQTTITAAKVKDMFKRDGGNDGNSN